MGCVVTWATWVRGLRGSKYFLRGSTFYVVQYIFVWVNFFFAWVQIFLCGSNFFAWVQNFAWVHFFFCVGQRLFTRRIYFAILQLIAQRIFSRVPSQQILTKPYLTSFVFLSSFLAKVDLRPRQRFRWRLLWHYLKADYLPNKELCLKCCGVLYTPMNAVNMLQLKQNHHQKNSLMTFN